GAETTFGKAVCGEHNAWNWFHCYANGTCGANACKSSPFPTWEKGALAVTKGLRRSYIRKGYDTIEEIRLKYCTEDCDNWVRLVTGFSARGTKGDVKDLPWPPQAGGEIAMANGTP